MNYILITPIKDEKENLSRLKETIVNQTVKPLIWVIVDSGSNDGGFEMANELFDEYEWIKIIKQQNFFESGYSIKNFAEAINEGYEYAKNLCNEKGINYSFVGKTDATPILEKKYFGLLLSKMKEDPRIAITCGTQILHCKGKKITIEPFFKIPLTGFNDIRLYSKKFFEEMGGYPLTFSPDGILLLKAVNRGWKVKIVDETNFIKPRLGGSKIGVWNGAKLKGKAMYVLGYHPLLAIFNALVASLKVPPHYQALSMIWGYLLVSIQRHEIIQDKEVLEYYGKRRLREVIYTFSNGMKFIKINRSGLIVYVFISAYLIGGLMMIISSFVYHFNKEHVGLAFLFGTVFPLVISRLKHIPITEGLKK